MATMNLTNNNQEFKTRHIYNVQERGMRRLKSLMKLLGKFARILVGMPRIKKFIIRKRYISYKLLKTIFILSE
ncbi:hypothetical protein AS030_02565 [Fictibacillus enclensis]|uniref:Uncharacterized protein n=1 Tax=Fictibacillus enclensis TaxID=1017270 RepID=A0A0V8JB89_9BACL|nr:hypothetical protein AS030_02565 [Fictibacillus enclensis]